VVVELAAALLVLSAPEGSASLNLARAALEARKPVFTLEHHMNRKLLDSSASVATLDRICAALR
jgi:predicted Rossmann fold nucleotide-binding protein DprA/Smf involved in DNA uptake